MRSLSVRLFCAACLGTLLVGCGQPDVASVATGPTSAPAASAVAATPMLVSTNTPAPPAEPTADPSVYATAWAEGTVLPAQPTPLSQPALPEPSLQAALQQLPADALLYTRPDRFLMLTSADHSRNVWVTNEACSHTNASTEQSGIWSTDKRYLAINCEGTDENEQWMTTILDVGTGALQRIAIGTQDTVSVAWSPSSPELILKTLGDGELFVVNAQTSKRYSLGMFDPDNLDAAWSPVGQAVAVLGREQADAPRSLFLVENNGADRRQVAQGDFLTAGANGNSIVWSADGQFVFLNRVHASNTAEANNEFVRITVATGETKVLADKQPDRVEMFWSPDGNYYVQGRRGAPGVDVGNWSIYKADGTLVRTISTEADRDDIAPRWMPGSQTVALFSVRFNVGVEVRMEPLQGEGRVIARFADVGPSFPALDVAPSGEVLAVGLSNGQIVVLNPEGRERGRFEGRIRGWRPNG